MHTLNQSTLSIIVPLFNEEQNVKQLIESILKVVSNNPRFLELILIDDGSTDSTVKLIKQFVNQDSKIHLIQHEQNKGLGRAIRTGLNAAQGDFILYTDADLPFDFALIPQLFSHTSDNAIITGFRLNRGEGLRRWVLTTGYNFMIWALFGIKLKDVNFACKIFPKSFVEKVKLISDGSFIDVEMLLESRRQALQIKQFPMTYFPRERGLSTLSRPQVVFKILAEMFKYKTNIYAKHTPLFSRGRQFLQRSFKLKPSA